VLRSTRIALALADRLGLDDEERAAVYYVTLLAFVGCPADSHEQAAAFGDDIAARAATYELDFAGAEALRFVLGHAGTGRPPFARARAVAAALMAGSSAVASMRSAHCAIAAQFAQQLGVGDRVAEALRDVFERWDGQM
jgi:hypothetical protein